MTFNCFLILYNLLIISGVLQKSNKYERNGGKVKYNPITHKIHMPINEATIYISSSMIDLSENNDDEVIGVCLHEIGHNLQMNDCILDLFVGNIANTISNSIAGITLLKLFEDSIKHILGLDVAQNNMSVPAITGIVDNQKIEGDISSRTNTVIDNFQRFGYILILLCIIGLVSVYIRRKMEIEADEFAIKCGYGKPFLSITKKMHDFIYMRDFGKQMKKIKGYNPFDFFLHILGLVVRWFMLIPRIFKFDQYPDPWTRERYIKEKTEAYDISDKHIDRTENIDKSWFK